MTIQVKDYVQEPFEDSQEYAEVFGIARDLLAHLNNPQVQNLIQTANAPGLSSALVQNTFLAQARELGFVNESRGLFQGYDNKAVRPDYYRPVGDSGILLEVERGKTTINNMDFLDFWKCHLCEQANYLFLMVPQALRQNESMAPRHEFNAVVKRLGSFFVPRNYTNVRGLIIFGY